MASPTPDLKCGREADLAAMVVASPPYPTFSVPEMKRFLSLVLSVATFSAHATSCGIESFSRDPKFVAAAFGRATDVLLIDVISASQRREPTDMKGWIEEVQFVVQASFKGTYKVGQTGVIRSEITQPLSLVRSVLNDPVWVESVEPGKAPRPAVLPKTWLVYIDSPDRSPFSRCSRSTPLWSQDELELVRVRRLAASRARR